MRKIVVIVRVFIVWYSMTTMPVFSSKFDVKIQTRLNDVIQYTMEILILEQKRARTYNKIRFIAGGFNVIF